MNFIQDFLSYNSGTECHVNYLRWSALSALAIAAGPRYYLQQGRIKVHTNDYIVLVGDQGVRKSYAKDQARDLISEALPDLPIGADLTSRDALAKFMSLDETERTYTSEKGIQYNYHPTALFINELKHMLTYNPMGMISFIVDIYDRCHTSFRGVTITRGEEIIEHPYLNILACENTDWLVNQVKGGLITGGFSRRFTVVFEPADPDIIISRPYLPKDHDILWERMKSHLQGLQKNSREYTWTQQGYTYFDEWYTKHKKNMPDDKVMRGFMRTKDQKVLKLVMWLDLADPNPGYKVTPELIEEALAFFEALEPNMPKLYMAAGRNELAIPQQGILDLLELNKGCMVDRELLRKIDKDFSPAEKPLVIKNLIGLGSMIKVQAKLDGEPTKVYFLSVKCYAEWKKRGTQMQVLGV